MGIALIKIKIMPSSPESNLEEIKQKAKLMVEEKKGKNPKFEEEEIAFGLKAVIISFQLDENYELDPIEEGLKTIEEVNSVQVVDMRRAIG
ncbi:elongation factor 1-beta [Candidatus Pacearchaeota archaeon]|nr:elongation factor 1-beta [Candidatus Pacearchaeota archaeon]